MTLDLGDCSDGELAALALAGRQTAYSELMRRYREPIYRLVRGYVIDADEALDVTQECFVSAFSALRRYDAARPFKIWVSRIAVNKCHDWARKRKVRRLFAFALPLADSGAVAADAVSAETALGDRQELAAVTAAIAKLPAALKDALVLRTVEGLSQAEAAQVLRVSEKAVETRLYRARHKLEELLRG